MFLSLSFFLPSPLSKNKFLKKTTKTNEFTKGVSVDRGEKMMETEHWGTSLLREQGEKEVQVKETEKERPAGG